ncbi:MAG: hypothetical protein JRI23_18130 [Deltaproteobacteria bacterium]|jgi:pimeloyl-ACP methyl ester carboxylesterase|nr:hypothetical protein [Deltaproteobacteria bacterium]MBW2533765.1 hypothetical protein [Deltaproteobacteria bacterium]
MKVVLLPGMDGTGELLLPLVDDLCERGHDAQTITYSHEAPQSYAELIEDVVLPALPESEPFVLMGESFSGPIALALAQRAIPGLVGLVLVVTFAEPPDNILLSLTRVLPVKWILSAPIPCWVAHKVMLSGQPVKGDQDALCRVIKMVQPAVLSERLREVRELRLAKKPIDIPAIYIRAADDQLLPADAVDGVKAIVPAVKVHDVPGPHLVLDTAPDICARLIDEFVRTLQPDEPRATAGAA